MIKHSRVAFLIVICFLYCVHSEHSKFQNSFKKDPFLSCIPLFSSDWTFEWHEMQIFVTNNVSLKKSFSYFLVVFENYWMDSFLKLKVPFHLFFTRCNWRTTADKQLNSKSKYLLILNHHLFFTLSFSLTKISMCSFRKPWKKNTINTPQRCHKFAEISRT